MEKIQTVFHLFNAAYCCARALSIAVPKHPPSISRWQPANVEVRIRKLSTWIRYPNALFNKTFHCDK